MTEPNDDGILIKAAETPPPELDQDHYPAPPSPLERAMTEMDRAMTALLLELPEAVYDDVQARWSAVRKLISPLAHVETPAPTTRDIFVVVKTFYGEDGQHVMASFLELLPAKDFVDQHIARSGLPWDNWVHLDADGDDPETWRRSAITGQMIIAKYEVPS